MNNTLLTAGIIEIEELKNLFKGYASPPAVPTFMLLEALPQRIVRPEARQDLLRFALFQPDFDLTLYTSGRVFHTGGEIRWEKRQAAFSIVYTGNEEYKPAFQATKQETLDSCDPVSRYYFLFGKRLDEEQLTRIGPAAQKGDFAEVRIPRLLRYPVLPALAAVERIQIAVYEYAHQETGKLSAYRFYNLVKPKEQTLV